MLRICIYDDESLESANLQRMIAQYARRKKIDTSVVELMKQDELLKRRSEFDVVFLVVQLRDLKLGFETGVKLRWLKSEAELLFYSEYDDYIRKSLELRAFRFFHKPIHETELNFALDDLLHGQNIQTNQVYIKIPSDVVVLDARNIVYIETNSRQRKITMRNGDCHFTNETIDSLRVKLSDKNFGQPRNGFLLNLAFVQKLTRHTLTVAMPDQNTPNEVELGRHYKKDFITSFSSFKVQ
ncbi:MAG: LytTR family transcriptional regulator DNA-binding domain-containing protein [Clostridiales bacterium]|jgi:DNA-binding LytR/AlgR family response regulator|nr:LytTR family transcriptional regulator DNA-binding domain-containing protein [Clostridiales bacterium]